MVFVYQVVCVEEYAAIFTCCALLSWAVHRNHTCTAVCTAFRGLLWERNVRNGGMADYLLCRSNRFLVVFAVTRL